MIAREMFVTMLQWADDETLENLLSVPGLEFSIPCPGLRWVQYIGKSCCRVGGSVISFDIAKIQGVRCLKQESVIDEEIEKELDDLGINDPSQSMAEAIGEELESDLNRDTNVEPNEEDT